MEQRDLGKGMLSKILDKTYLDANIAAKHWDRDATKDLNLNERNPGIGLEHDSGDWRQMVGQYKNSMNKNSIYALLGYTPFQTETLLGKLKAGIIGGGITGYDMPVAPAAGLLATLDRGNYGVNFTAVPDASINGKKAYGFLGAQLRYKLK